MQRGAERAEPPFPAFRIAKLTAPRPRKVLARRRLFTRLAKLVSHPVVWVSAPAGSGKTTLVATWLQEMRATAGWYQCDEGDADIASFFYFLSLIPADAVEGRTLPRLTPELYASQNVFARNYFREFFARFPTPMFLVLDNWQDVPAATPLRDLLPLILEEVPPGVTLIVISREDAPPNLSRALSDGRVALLGWDELRLTEGETRGLAALYERLPKHAAAVRARELQAATHGWAAGVTALLRYGPVEGAPQWSERHPSNQLVFDYLASEVFDLQVETVRDFLLQTAELETVPAAVARDLTHNEEAKSILDRLVRQNVFTVQRPELETYEYHPLLKQFLRSRSERIRTPTERVEHLRACARALTQHGRHEEAIALWLRAAAWREAVPELLGLAPQLMRQGRFKTLCDWVTLVPEDERQRTPWLTYWFGVAQGATTPPAALATLEAAYQQFAAEGDVLGQVLAGAEIVQLHQIGLGDLAASARWLEVLSALLEQPPPFPSADVELRIVAGFVGTLVLAKSDSALIAPLTERAYQLLDLVTDVQSQAYAVACLLSQQIYEGDSIRCRRLARVTETLLARADLAPSLAAQILMGYAFHHHLTGERDTCQALLERAHTLLSSFGLDYFALRIELAQLQTATFIEDRDQVRERLHRLEPMLAAAPPGIASHLAFVQQIFYLAAGDFERALSYGETQLQLARSVHYRFGEATAIAANIEISLETAHVADASEQLELARRLMQGTYTPVLDFHVRLCAADLARLQGDADTCIRELRTAFALGWRHRYASLAHGYTGLFRRLLPLAFEHGIEPEYALYLVRKRQLRPPSYATEHWPWPIRIFTLGRFAVTVDDGPLTFGAKPQQKPLDLLKCLLTQPEGISSAALTEQLWQHLDGQATRNALDLALHRLRRLLSYREAVVTEGGRLMLDRNQVWVDAWALQTLMERDPHRADGAVELAGQARKLLALYRGQFLADVDDPWAYAFRNRLCSQFARSLLGLVTRLQDCEAWAEANDLLNQAIEIDVTNEALHRCVIMSHRRQGQHAEAVAAYWRCREALKRLLGVEPSEATRALLT